MHSRVTRLWLASLTLAWAATSPAAQTALNFGNLPLWFESVQDPAGRTSEFIAKGRDARFSISAAASSLILRQAGGPTASVRMQLVGANPSARISGGDELKGKINYLIGSDPKQWQTGLATFARVQLTGIYPGVDVVYYGNQQKLEYDFDLAPGVKPETIAIRFEGAQHLCVNPQGELVISLDGGTMIQHAPVAYQVAAGTRQAVTAGYKLVDDRTVAFAIGDYRHDQPLVIDPVLGYSTFFGGSAGEIAHAVALDSSGDIYIAGETFSTAISNNVPFATPGAFQTTNRGGLYNGDAFVAKLDSLGTNLIYLTYLGGSADESINGLALDAANEAVVTGFTDSSNFPTANALFPSIGGPPAHKPYYLVDAFITKLNTNGSGLVYSTFLGGYGVDAAYGIAIDTNSGVTYVAGFTSSTNFPCTTNAFQSHLVCTNALYNNANAFITAISGPGTNLIYSSYFGGTNYDQATGIALDAAKAIYVTGYTSSTNFPTTNALAGFGRLNGTNNNLAFDAFVTKFNPGFNGLAYSTFLGGTNNDYARGIAVDAAGNAYVVGSTTSTNFPYTNIAASFSTNLTSFVRTNLTTFVVATNSFLAQISWNGTNASLGYSLMFGGYGADVANAVALDAADNIYVVGSASSTNFPVTSGNLLGSLRATNSGGEDVFVTVFKSDFSGLIYSAYLGGAQDDFGNAIALDSAGNAYVVGQTLSTNFPVFNARQTLRNGTNDAFLTKILLTTTFPPLSAHVSPAGVQVSWPPEGAITTNALGLQTSTNLLTTNWVFVSQVPVLTNGAYTFTFTPTNPVRFFRLHNY